MGSWWTPVGWVPHLSVATFMDRRLCLALAVLGLAVTVWFFIVVFCMLVCKISFGFVTMIERHDCSP